MKFDTPITAAAKRMTMLLETGYLDRKIAEDIRTLMHGAMAYEVITTAEPKPDPRDAGQTAPAPAPTNDTPIGG